MEYIFRLSDFNIYNEKEETYDEEEEESKINKDNNNFMIQMFGLDEKGKTYSLIVEGFRPFFYLMVNDKWKIKDKNDFLIDIQNKIGNYYKDSITKCKIIKRRKLYGFDGEKEHKFIFLEFSNLLAFNKVKNLWYSSYEKGHTLLKDGYYFNNTNILLYEANIPPLLRSFHIKNISPSGWIAILKKKSQNFSSNNKSTTINCDYTIKTEYENIIPLNDKETRVPYKVMCVDIEASSSHGDFPVPIKTYKKLATNIIEHFENLKIEMSKDICKNILIRIILSAFGFDKIENIDLVYPKIPPKSKKEVEEMCEKWFLIPVKNFDRTNEGHEINRIEKLFEKMSSDEDDNEEEYNNNHIKMTIDKKTTIIDIICDKKFSREIKISEIFETMFDKKRKNNIFPELEGDKCTFIGSTFMKYGDTDPYFNHCIVLNSCSELTSVQNSVIESYPTEKEVLLAWQELVQRENPDIIIGYNIFGFDYEFMFRRAEENDCVEEFLQLSRNKNEICATKDKITDKYKIEETTLQIASGQHDLRFIKMNGRLQIDLYNFYRRNENLTSYKLDYVAGYFIGDLVKTIEYENTLSIIKTGNMTGLLVGSYIHFEEIGHSVDYYANGAKFIVTEIDKTNCQFVVDGHIDADLNSKKVRWCLAKDDVSPKDIFRMTNGTADDRSIIAKYCIQDCNLVHYLFNKSDILTGFIEMAKICSVPINFLVMRGQGIKLTSYVAKKCREKRVLMPVIEKGTLDEGYEGAIVLDPKCDLYLDNPVACVDYASLYPSSMISENLSHDSKVWTLEYDLAGNLIEEWGDKDKNGNYIYDNLPGYEYVDVTYDTYVYRRKHPKAAAEKVLNGHKICRFVQPSLNGEREAIMPSILKELLKARKDTRKLIPLETDEFMKNVLDQRQLGYKVTANSLYGQCGAKTSTFYEKDIAACTTATGRKLLTYAKRVIEECYGDNLCDTEKFGPVLTKAEYIYGDSVANYTPIKIRINDIVEILTIEKLAEKFGNNRWVTCTEPNKQEKEFCELTNIETWSENGWTKLYRVIRHKLAKNKKMLRVITNTGLVDVTDDHSLLLPNGNEISPTDCQIGTTLLHQSMQLGRGNNINLDNFDLYVDIRKVRKYYSDDHVYLATLASILHNFKIYEFEDKFCLEKIDSEYYIHNANPFIIKNIHEIDYQGYVYDLTTDNHHFAAGIGNLIVHNTDSVFFTFNLQTPDGQPIRGKDALEITIELAQQAGHLASSFLKVPHDLEYEKTFMPFCLLSKKRYVGMLYETDPNKCKRKEMGIVLKRRDNAPIVKDIYGGIIDILMKKQNIQEAIDFLKDCLQNIVQEKYSMDKLIITKSLRSGYKNPQSIAHKVLADRITARDPGNKPGPGDRIPFVYIFNKNKKALQGEKIETPTFIIENGLKIDYSFYITNQIMKPVQQVFALVLEKIWLMNKKLPKIKQFKKSIEILKSEYTDNLEKFQDKFEALRCKEIKTLLFDEYLRETNNEKEGVQSLTKFFVKK
jgi:DNA polymerase elongation subunit (family B)